MSISLILVPAAIAAVSAWHASRPEIDSQGRTVCRVGTRMRDERLLAEALVDTRATVNRSEGHIIADWQGIRAAFSRDERGIWQVDMTGDVSEQVANAIVASVDAAYSRRVQAAVIARLKERAPIAGMKVESEQVEEDLSVTLILSTEVRT